MSGKVWSSESAGTLNKCAASVNQFSARDMTRSTGDDARRGLALLPETTAPAEIGRNSVDEKKPKNPNYGHNETGTGWSEGGSDTNNGPLLGFADGGRWAVYAHPFSEAVHLVEVATGMVLEAIDEDGPLWTVEEDLEGLEWVCEGTRRRWRLECPLSESERVQMATTQRKLLAAAKLLALALQASPGSEKSPAYFRSLAASLIAEVAP